MKELMLESKQAYLEDLGNPHLYSEADDYYFFLDGYKIYLPLEFQDEETFRFRKEFGVDPVRKKVTPPSVSKFCQICDKSYYGIERSRYCSYPCIKKSYAQMYLY